MTPPKPQFSVIICTYNRKDLLSGLLLSLEKQDLERTLFEVLIVNNNSTDGTQELANDFAARHENFRVFFEESQGLSHARNCGWKNANGQYVAYIDDDSKAPFQWLTVATVIAARYSPDVFGGPYYPFYVSSKPKWWKDSYRAREHAESARFLSAGENLSGGNIFFRREALENSPGFDPSLGMKGNRIGLGEEDALLTALRQTWPGLTLYYDPRLFVYHLVHPNKMTLSWAIRKRFADGRYSEKLRFPNQSLSVKRSSARIRMVSVSWQIVQATLGLFYQRDRHLYPFLQNYIYERLLPYVRDLGKLYERWKLSPNKSSSSRKFA